MNLFLAAFLSLVVTANACANSQVNRDSEIITDPTFAFTISPPVRWTYFPQVAVTGGVAVTNFFPGQSSTASDALQAAQNEVMAAFLEALSELPVSTLGVTTTVSYSPDEISNCYIGQAIPAGTRIGYLAGGAITQVAVVNTQQATVTSCPLSTTQAQTGIGPYMDYIKMVTVSTRGGTTLARYNWNRVLSQFQSTLSFRYQALFRSQVTVNNS